jgi:F420-dependent oxidoreductase-like protein
MDVGLMAPQGWKGEYAGWEPAAAWARTVELAQQAEQLGFESLWVFDHFHTILGPADRMNLEGFAVLGGLSVATQRVRLGHMVVCAGFRNPALTAKMASTLDVMSGGRFELGVGAGWKEDEWLSYGYAFPTLRERLANLGDQLEVIRRMLDPGRATYQGEYAHVEGAINEPRGLQQPRIPIIVGGNGRRVTFRLAARHADELNVVFLSPEGVAELLPIVRQRCEEEDRDPASLRISLYTRDGDIRPNGQERVDFLGQVRDLGIERIVCFLGRWSVELEAQERFAEDCRVVGLLAAR